MSIKDSNATLDLSNITFKASDIIFVVMAILIVLVNSGVLFMMCKTKSLHNAQNGLLASLAVSDLSSGLFGIPLLFACSFVPTRFCALCSVSYYFFKFVSISTVLHILAIIGERCFLVVDPFMHRRLRSTAGRSNFVIIASIWLTSLVVSSVPWAWVVKTFDDCLEAEDWHAQTWDPDSVYELACFVLFFIIPLALIMFFLAKIFIAVHQFTRRQSQRCSEDMTEKIRLFRREMRIFTVLLCVFVLFIVCWLPYFAITLVHFINAELPEWMYEATPYFRSLTSLVNPLVYAFYKDDFYQAMKRRLLGLKCWSKARDSDVFTSRQKAHVPLVAV